VLPGGVLRSKDQIAQVYLIQASEADHQIGAAIALQITLQKQVTICHPAQHQFGFTAMTEPTLTSPAGLRQPEG